MAQLVHNTQGQQVMIVPAASPTGKDSRWLTLEVCREFQRSKCSRSDTECKFAHPPPHVEIQNGRVVACFDSIKGKCQRKDPPCKYLHPPQHLREQLLQNGRNNLILKNLQLQTYQPQYASMMPMAHPSTSQAPPQAVMRPPTMTPGAIPSPYDAATHYPGLQALSAVPAQAPAATYSPYLSHFASMAMPASADPNSIMSQQLPPSMLTAKSMRADKFETSADINEAVTSHASLMDSFSYPTYFTQVCREFQRGTCTRAMSECRYAHPAEHIAIDATDNHITVCMDYIKSKCTRDLCKYFHPPNHLQALVRAAHARNQAAISNNSSPTCSALATSSATMPHMLIGKKRTRDPADDLLLQSAGIVPTYKRIAISDFSKGGYPVYQTNPFLSPLQHTSLMQLQQQPSYIPMSYTYIYPPDATLGTPVGINSFLPQHLTAALPPTMLSSVPYTSTTTTASSIISPVTTSTSVSVNTTSSSENSILTSPSGLNLYMINKSSPADITTSTHGATNVPSIPTNAYYVEYFGNNKQLRDTLQVCQEFRSGLCNSPYCKLVHLSEDYVEVTNNQVTVCRDFATRQTCRRSHCKYYHIPIELPPS